MWFGVLCLVSILVVKILFYYRRPHKFPPGPPGLPLVGNTLDIAKVVKETKYYSDAWCRLADKYGPIVGLRLGFAEPLIIVSGKEAITKMLTQPEFDGRCDGFLFKFRCGGLRRGLMFTDADVWHSQKRFSLKTLIQFGFGKYSMEQVIQQDAIRLTDIIANLTKDGAAANISTIITVAVLSNLWFIIDGTKFDVGTETLELKELIHVFKKVLKSTNIVGGILTQFPFLRYIFPKLTGFSTFKRRHEYIDKFITDVISKHKKKATQECTSFIDVYLKEIEVQEAKSPFTSFNESQLIYVLKDLIAAGVDTTDNTIGFTLAYLVVHQRVQHKLHDEIDRVIGKDICPSLSDKSRLPYLNAVLSEVWRMANITSTTLPHRAMTDSTLLGFEIKKNYSLLANFQSVHMDEEHWGDPEVFRPERFIDEDGKFIDDPWLMPFGYGRRKCLGECVARNTVFIFLACLFQKLHFMLPENHPKLCLKGIEGFVISPPKMDVIVTQRH